MKKILLIAVSLMASSAIYAQPWEVPSIEKPVKLEDLEKEFKARNQHLKSAKAKSTRANDSTPIEDKSYHFGRWKWYWERHTDDKGYVVSPTLAAMEWKKYHDHKAASGATFKTTANPSDWVFEGPDSSASGYNGIGRINVVSFHPTDTNTFWIGSAGGGAWKTHDHGMTWQVINDNFKVLGVSDIEFNPLNPNTIYICTGDKNHSDTYSIGVLKSTDGGNTWDTTGLKWEPSEFRLTNDLVINPLDTNSLTLATSTGVSKSYDGGAIWTQTTTGHFKQLVAHPTDTAILFAPSFSTGAFNQIMRSEDGGATWQSALVVNATRRIAVAVTADNPAIVKAIVVNGDNGLEGIYNSTDTGKTFTKIFSDNNCTTNILANDPKGEDCGGQGWYDLTIAIDPQNEDFVIAGGVNTWYSTDGGFSWTINNQWTSRLPGITVVHADKHFHGYHPLVPGRLFECNDGGIYFSDNAAAGIWTDITNGLGITQFYRNAVSSNASFVLGGAQDNGTKMIKNGHYSEMTGGDGMDCHIDYSNSAVFYTSSQYGVIRRTIDGGNRFFNISRNIPGDPDGEWITPFLIHPDTPAILIAGYKNVFLSRNRGTSWTAISPDFPSNIKRLAMSSANPRHIYAQVSNDIRWTNDYGETWQFLNIPYSGTVSDITAHPRDSNHIWVTFSGYGTTSLTGKVAQYKDGVWTQKNDDLPNIPVNCIIIDSSDLTVYIGTDFGVFYRTPTMTGWEEYNNKLPSTEVIDLGINYTTGDIWAATYGRGMWKSPKNNINLNPAAINPIPLASQVAKLYPNPSHGRFEMQTDNAALQNENLMVRITSISGATVWQNSVKTSADGKASIDASSLPQGTYILHILKDNMVFAKEKIVVLK